MDKLRVKKVKQTIIWNGGVLSPIIILVLHIHMVDIEAGLTLYLKFH